jgi:hypothetical protein
VHLALFQAESDSNRKTFHPGMNKTLQHYGRFVSTLQPRSFVPETDMSVIMEMRHGTTTHSDLDLRNDWNATSLLRRFEDIVVRIWMDMQKFLHERGNATKARQRDSTECATILSSDPRSASLRCSHTVTWEPSQGMKISKLMGGPSSVSDFQQTCWLLKMRF